MTEDKDYVFRKYYLQLALMEAERRNKPDTVNTIKEELKKYD